MGPYNLRTRPGRSLSASIAAFQEISSSEDNQVTLSEALALVATQNDNVAVAGRACSERLSVVDDSVLPDDEVEGPTRLQIDEEIAIRSIVPKQSEVSTKDPSSSVKIPAGSVTILPPHTRLVFTLLALT